MKIASAPVYPRSTHRLALRLIRRAMHRLLPRAWLAAPGLRIVLGVECTHGHVLDRVEGFALEYSLDSLIGQLVFLQGGFEDTEAAFIQRRLQCIGSGAVVLDIGANIGLHSLRAARLPEVCRVFAFEPGRSTFAMLKRNITRNALAGKIYAYPLAVAEYTGRAQFHFCADDAYSSLTPDDRRPVQQTYEVAVTNIDEWLLANAVERVDLIKIDVEGSESAVIAGAQAALCQYKPELIVEIYEGNRSNFSAVGLIEKICSLGYDAFVLIEGMPVAFQCHDDAHFNYHFVPRG